MVWALGHLEEVEHFRFLPLIPMLVCLLMLLASLVPLSQWLGLELMRKDDLEDTIGYISISHHPPLSGLTFSF